MFGLSIGSVLVGLVLGWLLSGFLGRTLSKATG
jgi:F0F1-type ATP synthase assembly protein I